MKRILSIILSFTMVFSLSATAFAAENPENANNIHDQDIVLTDSDISGIKQLDEAGLDGELIEKLLTVSNHIAFSDDQKTLKIDLSNEVLTNEYGFTEQQLVDLAAILNGTYQAPSVSADVSADFYQNYPTTKAARFYVARFYLSNADLQAGTFAVLATAAQAGPAALMAAWTSISTALAGPLGTVAGLATAILGVTFFADLAFKITGALVQRKGVAFYLVWGIPPVKTAIE